MDFESGIGKDIISRHEKLIDLDRQLLVEERARREEEHADALQSEPFQLACKLMMSIARDRTVESVLGGRNKVYAPLRSNENGLNSRLGVEGRLSFSGDRVVNGQVLLSLFLIEGDSNMPHKQKTSEQILGIVHETVGIHKHYGFERYDYMSGLYMDTNILEAREMAAIVREAAEIEGLPVLPLELPQAEQPAL